MMDNYDRFALHDQEQEDWYNKLPLCDICEAPIQQDTVVRIRGQLICDSCLEFWRVPIEEVET